MFVFAFQKYFSKNLNLNFIFFLYLKLIFLFYFLLNFVLGTTPAGPITLIFFLFSYLFFMGKEKIN